MLSRLKNLMKFDQRRLDVALLRIRGKKALIFCFNVFLLMVNSLGYLKRLIKRVLAKLGIVKSPAQIISLSSLPIDMPAHGFADKYRVLIVCERSIPQCLRYRVVQKTQQLIEAGHHAKWLDWTEYFDVRNEINFHDVIIFYRVPGYPASTVNIEYAKALNKIVIYDIDDLVFDKQELSSYYKDHGSQLTKKEFAGVLKGADLYRNAIELCDYVTTSTPVLKSRLEGLFDSPDIVFLHPNGVDEILREAGRARIKKDPNTTVLFYGSGSNTHDNDFDLIAPSIEKLLKNYNHVELVIVGHLTLPKRLRHYESRISQFPIMPVEQYLLLVKRADINLAPLVSGLFADCKSEIKWLEAAYLGVPSVVSDTDIYRRVIRQSVTGILAQGNGVDELMNEAAADSKVYSWYQAIEMLVNHKDLRDDIAQNAKLHIERKYSENYLGQKLSDNIAKMVERNRVNNRAYLKHDKNKLQSVSALNQGVDVGLENTKPHRKRIVLVNVLYPPQAMGGATIVVRNIAEQLAQRYHEAYDVFVLTTDIENLYSYQVKTYALNNVKVTAISVPKGADIDNRYCDDTVGEMVRDYFQWVQPDFIHFHCIQHLTASILDAALDLNIPYFVTVHDAWWLSQHQFLLDAHGAPVDSNQSDPLKALKTVDQPLEAGEILKRYQFLVKRLNKARAVFAVSEYQKTLYQNNGVDNVLLNINGVDEPRLSEGKLSLNPDDCEAWSSQKNATAVLGFVGSICHHKGYYFAKEAISRLSESQDLSKISVVVIDFNTKEHYQEQWGSVVAHHIPKLSDGKMAEFYHQIDVLLAPSIWPESFGIVSREAVLTGTYAVVSASGGLAEVINDNLQSADGIENGSVFEMGDSESFQAIIENINSQPQRYKTKISPADVSNIISVSDQVDNLVNDYKALI